MDDRKFEGTSIIFQDGSKEEERIACEPRGEILSTALLRSFNLSPVKGYAFRFSRLPLEEKINKYGRRVFYKDRYERGGGGGGEMAREFDESDVDR